MYRDMVVWNVVMLWNVLSLFVYFTNMYHRKNSIKKWDENVLYYDRSFLRFTTFGTTKANFVFVAATVYTL